MDTQLSRAERYRAGADQHYLTAFLGQPRDTVGKCGGLQRIKFIRTVTHHAGADLDDKPAGIHQQCAVVDGSVRGFIEVHGIASSC